MSLYRFIVEGGKVKGALLDMTFIPKSQFKSNPKLWKEYTRYIKKRDKNER